MKVNFRTENTNIHISNTIFKKEFTIYIVVNYFDWRFYWGLFCEGRLHGHDTSNITKEAGRFNTSSPDMFVNILPSYSTLYCNLLGYHFNVSTKLLHRYIYQCLLIKRSNLAGNYVKVHFSKKKKKIKFSISIILE